MRTDRLGLACHNGASLTQRINQVARERNEVAIYEELLSKSNEQGNFSLPNTSEIN